MSDKKVNYELKYKDLKIHFIYSVVIGVAIIVILLALMFYPSVKAGEMLSFAGTITSIILAVLAIMITLIDAAGQRSTVANIKETAETLQNNLDTVNESISEISELKEDLIKSMSLISASNAALSKDINKLVEKYNSPGEGDSNISEEVVEDLRKLSEKFNPIYEDKYFLKNNHIHTFATFNNWNKSNRDRMLSHEIQSLILGSRNKIKNGKFKLNDVLWMMNEINVSRSRLKKELDFLVKRGALDRDGEYYVYIG